MRKVVNWLKGSGMNVAPSVWKEFDGNTVQPIGSEMFWLVSASLYSKMKQ